jgi:transposase-like protein
MDRDLSCADCVYVWADGVLLRIRLEEAKAAVLVLMGVRADGTKELIAMTGGYRESSEAWAGLLRGCARRGMRAPVLGVGALDFWNALNEVFPGTRHPRCCFHKTVNVLDALPKSAQRAAERAVQEICNAGDKEHAGRAVRDFVRACQAKYPKVVKRITDDEDELLAFFDFPAEHWITPQLVAPVRAGTRFEGGHLARAPRGGRRMNGPDGADDRCAEDEHQRFARYLHELAVSVTKTKPIW